MTQIVPDAETVYFDLETDAKRVAIFYNTLLKENLPEQAAKELTMAWIASRNH